MGRKHLYMCIALLMFTLSGMLPVYAEQTEFETEAGTEFETEPELESETETESESETEQSDFEIEGTILTAYHGTSAEVIVPSGVTEIAPVI